MDAAPVRGFRRLFRVLLPCALVAACGGSGGDPARPVPAADPAAVYEAGPHAVTALRLADGEAGNPRELLVLVPQAGGRYPLLQFQHGFVSDIDSYTQVLTRLASHGFVIVAPQMYVGDPSSAPPVVEERDAALDVLRWAQASLDGALAARLAPGLAVTVDAASTGVFGHSRGGQIAWRMLVDPPLPFAARAVAGIDPVDGDAPPFPPGQTGELVSDDRPGGFGLPFASLVLGMGRGATGVPGFECAPAVRNYRVFYDASAAPRYELVATDFGHADVTNGDAPDAVCPGDLAMQRPALRAFVAGQLAAHFATVLKGQDLRAVLRDPTLAPIAATGRFEE